MFRYFAIRSNPSSHRRNDSYPGVLAKDFPDLPVNHMGAERVARQYREGKEEVHNKRRYLAPCIVDPERAHLG